MPPDNGPTHAIRWLVVAALGLLVTALYFVLRAHRLGALGAPTDIGGGVVLLLGLFLCVTGLVGSTTVAVSRFREHRRSEGPRDRTE